MDKTDQARAFLAMKGFWQDQSGNFVNNEGDDPIEWLVNYALRLRLILYGGVLILIALSLLYWFGFREL